MIKKSIRMMLFGLFALLLTVILGGLLYLMHPRFGALAKGERLKRMESTETFSGGVFTNLENTPSFAPGIGMGDVFRNFLKRAPARKIPNQPIPVVETNLRQLPSTGNYLVWFGHSSYLLRLEGKTILVDPVFSTYASPVRLQIRAFDVTYTYSVDDLPEIDLLIITHDHWDHLDYNTIKGLQPKISRVLTGLGVGAHFERWGFSPDKITELYWGESWLFDNLRFTSVPTRHFSGRTFKRNTSLWSAFVVEASHKLLIGGDSGFGSHFETIAAEFAPFDFVILENGQYDKLWPYIHMTPEEVVKTSQLLDARFTIPVHSGKFPLANHDWDEPLRRVTLAAKRQNVSLLTPKIGELLDLDAPNSFTPWWNEID